MKILSLQKNNMKMKFSEQTKKIAEKYNINEIDVLFAKIINAEISLEEAFGVVYGKIIKTENVNEHLKKMFKEKPGLKVFILKLKEGKKSNAANFDDVNELGTKEGVISFLQRNLAMTTGKEAVSGAQALAKFLGFDKEDKKEEEKKVFHLPYKSNCRLCGIYKVYRDLFEAEKK